MNTLMALLVISALIASINPCTMSVLIMSISSLIGKGKHPKHVALHTFLFGLGIFVSYSLLGLVLMLILGVLPIGIVGYIALVVGVLISIFGLLEIKDYFWYGRGPSFKLTEKTEQRVHAWTKQHHSPVRGFLLGIYTSVKMSHYTFILVAMSALIGTLLTSNNYILSVIWAFWYVIPVFFIAVLSASGVNPHNLFTWKEQSKHTMRLSIGLLYVLLGWLMLVILAGGLKLV